MTANVNLKKQCITCNKSTGVLICDGCEQIFCGKHVIQHRQDLAGQLECIMQEHDVLQHDIEQMTVDKLLLKKIDLWEKESTEKIRLAATSARKNLQILVDQSQERLSKVCRDMAYDIHVSREADDYSEHDFKRWIGQLEEIKLQIQSSSSAKITQNKNSIIHLITIESNDLNKNKSTTSKQPSLSTNLTNLKHEEKFVEVHGSVTITDKGCLAKHNGHDGQYGCIRGHLLYSHGCHTIRFKLKEFKRSHFIFFGCISSQAPLGGDVFKSPAAVGWFGYNRVYEHGRCSTNCQKYGYNSYVMRKDDVLHLEFDCDNKQIKLYNKRMNTRCKLHVDVTKIPYPWQLLVVMPQKDDCVRILPNM